MNIVPYPKNAKKHPRTQIKALGRSIEAFGFSPAIEVDTEGIIVSGHERFQAAQELGVRAIGNSSKSEDIVLDLFLGSGSTLIAAEKTGRVCYGCELDEKYVDVIIKRWEDYTGQKALKI